MHLRVIWWSEWMWGMNRADLLNGGGLDLSMWRSYGIMDLIFHMALSKKMEEVQNYPGSHSRITHLASMGFESAQSSESITFLTVCLLSITKWKKTQCIAIKCIAAFFPYKASVKLRKHWKLTLSFADMPLKPNLILNVSLQVCSKTVRKHIIFPRSAHSN